MISLSYNIDPEADKDRLNQIADDLVKHALEFRNAAETVASN
jgi:hypothetical protein